MRAIRVHAKGGPEQFVFEDVPKPALAEGDVLIRVRAAGVTPAELSWETTYVLPDGASRLPSIPGHELSGVVQTTTDGADGLVEGEAVYGLIDFWRDGDFAEFVAVSPTNLAPKPRSVSHEHAAAAALSGLTAWQALFRHGGLSAGQRVLIHGAAGGVGSFAVQLARWRGAEVIATARGEDRDFVRDLGASEVIDYTVERFEDTARDVDVVLDTIGGETLERSCRVVRPGGVVVTLVEAVDADKTARGIRSVFFIVKPDRADLNSLAHLLDTAEIRAVVADVLPFARAKEAFMWGLQRHLRGKLVLRLDDDGRQEAVTN